MKTFARFVVFLSLLMLAPQMARAAAANEVYLTQRNSGNTANVQRVVAPVATSVLAFDASYVPVELTMTQLVDRLGSTQGSILYRNGSAWVPLTPGTSGQLLSTQGAAANPIWVTATGGAGDFNGPASATDNALVRFDGTGGKTGQTSVVIVDDSGTISSPSGQFSAYATRPGIISTGASAVGTTQDNTGLAFGTADLSIGAWVRLPDWTPGGVRYITDKNSGATNLAFYIDASNRLALAIGASTYHSTTALTVADGAWAHLAVAIDRDGNATWYVNGAAFGSVANISASSATTLTGTGALAWFSSSSGGSPTAGTLGETFLINGLLTATNVADIYKAGSIAPFSASFTFYQWADFGQGYGPIIKDRSGQNQPALMGTSGLTHAVPRNPPGVPRRAPQIAIVGDGSNGSFARNTLNAQNPGTGEVAVWWDGILPTADSGYRALWALTQNTTTADQAKSLFMQWQTSNGLQYVFRGADPALDYRQLGAPALATLLGGKRVVIVTTRAAIYLGIDGDFINATALFAAASAGTPPTWASSEIDGDYLLANYFSASNSAAATVFDLRLSNVAMTEAQLRTEYERGEPSYLWQGASKTAKYASDFSAGADSFSADLATATGNIDSINAVDDVLRVYANASSGAHGAHRTLSSLATPGKYWRFTGSIYVPTPQTGLTTVDFMFGGQPAGAGRWTKISGTSSFTPNAAWQTFDIVLRNDSADAATFYAYMNNAGTFTGANSTTDDVFYLKSLNLEQLGYTARLRTDTAAGLTALNSAKSSTNDSTDFLLSTTGVTTSPDGRTQTIRATTTTSGNEQLFGASVIDTTKNWRIRSWSVVSSGTPTVSLGSASAGAQYVSGAVLAAAQNEITLLTRVPASANLWCNSNSTATNKHTVVLELVD